MELGVGQTLVGRHDTCNVVIDDPLASRRHAILSFNGVRLVVKDLQSVNGVLVNGERMKDQQTLAHGDVLRLGSEEIEVSLTDRFTDRPRRTRVGVTTLMSSPAPEIDDMEGERTVVREGERLEMLVAVADKALVMGRGQDAERILSNALKAPLERLQAGCAVDERTLSLAALYSARLAAATGKGHWVDQAVELYRLADRVMPSPVVEQLFESVRAVDKLDIQGLRDYQKQMQRRSDQLGLADRFLLRRLEGLERLALA